jgi:hypothetical protein
MEGAEETYTPSEAARIMRLTPHRVRQLLNRGELEGEQDPETGHWTIPQRAVHARLEERPRQRRGSARRSEPEPEPAEGGDPRLAEVEAELRRTLREMGRMEGRLELTEVTESTLREQLERERERADRLEAELREAYRRRAPWWRRLFGAEDS